MKKHNGMRPQDVAILLKITQYNSNEWQISALSHQINLSMSSISESLDRCKLAGLIDHDRKRVNRLNFLEFLEHGFKYVFPVEIGTITRGIPTAHSHPFFANKITSEQVYVWPDFDGREAGLAVDPLYPKVVKAVKNDDSYYKLLALTDVLRIGKLREINLATKELKNLIL